MTPVAKNRYFTLIELLAAIAIIIILAGILIGGLGHASKKADISKAISLMEQLQMGLEEFKDQNGFYPQSATAKNVTFGVDTDGLYFSDSSCHFVKKGTTRPFIEIGTEGDYEDPWGNAFQYMCPGTNNPTSYDLWSNGLNGVFDSNNSTTNDTDDINNWSQH
ncbi:MAG: type II secretion system protein GspG [Lentisphaeria bacterium]